MGFWESCLDVIGYPFSFYSEICRNPGLLRYKYQQQIKIISSFTYRCCIWNSGCIGHKMDYASWTIHWASSISAAISLFPFHLSVRRLWNRSLLPTYSNYNYGNFGQKAFFRKILRSFSMDWYNSIISERASRTMAGRASCIYLLCGVFRLTDESHSGHLLFQIWIHGCFYPETGPLYYMAHTAGYVRSILWIILKFLGMFLHGHKK